MPADIGVVSEFPSRPQRRSVNELQRGCWTTTRRLPVRPVVRQPRREPGHLPIATTLIELVVEELDVLLTAAAPPKMATEPAARQEEEEEEDEATQQQQQHRQRHGRRRRHHQRRPKRAGHHRRKHERRGSETRRPRRGEDEEVLRLAELFNTDEPRNEDGRLIQIGDELPEDTSRCHHRQDSKILPLAHPKNTFVDVNCNRTDLLPSSDKQRLYPNVFKRSVVDLF